MVPKAFCDIIGISMSEGSVQGGLERNVVQNRGITEPGTRAPGVPWTSLVGDVPRYLAGAETTQIGGGAL